MVSGATAMAPRGSHSLHGRWSFINAITSASSALTACAPSNGCSPCQRGVSALYRRSGLSPGRPGHRFFLNLRPAYCRGGDGCGAMITQTKHIVTAQGRATACPYLRTGFAAHGQRGWANAGFTAACKPPGGSEVERFRASCRWCGRGRRHRIARTRAWH